MRRGQGEGTPPVSMGDNEAEASHPVWEQAGSLLYSRSHTISAWNGSEVSCIAGLTHYHKIVDFMPYSHLFWQLFVQIVESCGQRRESGCCYSGDQTNPTPALQGEEGASGFHDPGK